MPTTLRFGITWEERAMEEWSYTAEGASAVKYANVLGSDLSSFVVDMLGWSDISGTLIRRNRPDSHPRWNHLYCVGAEHVEPLGLPTDDGPGTSLEFGRVLVKVSYKSLPYEVRDDDDVSVYGTSRELRRNVIRKRTFSVESMLVPGGTFQFSDGTKIPEPPAMATAGGVLSLTWVGVPMVFDSSTNTWGLHSQLEANIATVTATSNSAAFYGFPKDTLLCLAPETEPLQQADGTWSANIHYQFAIRGNTDNSGVAAGTPAATPDWRRVYRPKSGAPGWYLVQRTDDTTKSVYERADPELLFKLTA